MMVILRGLGANLVGATSLESRHPISEGALGDWYLHGLAANGTPLWLLISCPSMLTVITPASQPTFDAQSLRAVVAARLLRLGVELSLIGSELATMRTVVTAPPPETEIVAMASELADIVVAELAGCDIGAIELRRCENLLAEYGSPAVPESSARLTARRRALQLLDDRWAIRDSVMRQDPNRHGQALRRGHRPAPVPTSPANLVRRLNGD